MKKIVNWLLTDYKGDKVAKGWIILHVIFLLFLLGVVLS
jgi:hypothetical protein